MIWLAACVHAPVERDKGLTPSTTTLAALQQARAPRREALLIGIDAYADPTFPPLRHAEDDARELGARLAVPELGGFDRVRVLTGDAADREDIVEALREVRDTVRREDVLVVYFSGHGTRARDSAGAWHRYLVPRDGVAADLATSALDLAEIQAFFGSLAPARKALVVDACFDGDGRSVVAADDGPAPDAALVPSAAVLSPGEAYLFATTSGRPAREDDSLGHGVYTWYWLDALSWGFGDADVDRDNVLTAWEIHDYARGRTLEYTDGAQVPEAALRIVGEGDLVVAGDPDPRKRADRALVYLYPSGAERYAGATLVVDGREKGALPGTIPIEPGRHHVLLRDPTGAVLVDGYLRLTRGRGYPVSEVERLAQGPEAAFGVRGVALTSAPLAPALGSGASGAEVYLADRATTSLGRGFVRDGVLGVGGSPGAGLSRPVAWAAAGVGWQGDVARLRFRVGVGVSALWVPPRWDVPPAGDVVLADHPGQIGWWALGAGPSGGIGWVLGRGWTVTASARPHVSALDVDFDRRVEAVPVVAGAFGIEIDR